jgi:hypothetical protein
MNTRSISRFGVALATVVAGVALGAPAGPAAASAGHNVVLNGGFEQQQASSSRPRHWIAKGAANDFSGSAHSGTYNLDLVVGEGFPKVASVSQNVTIAGSASKATLTFWTEDWSCGDNIHFDAHVIAGGHDNIVKTIPGASCGTGYVKSSVSVTRFAGQTVTLRLAVTRVSGTQIPLFYLDDVALRVS